MKAKAAQQFAEADESMDDEASPLVQKTIRQADKQKVVHQTELAARLRSREDADATTDFENLNIDDASLLMESSTPDISQLIAQTPMKLNSSGGWTQTQRLPLAALAQRSREAGPRPVLPRTPPRKDVEDDSFEETPRAGYTFEAQEKDDSIHDEEDPTVILGKPLLEHDTTPSPPPQESLPPSQQLEDAPALTQSSPMSLGPVHPSMESDTSVSVYSSRMRSFNVRGFHLSILVLKSHTVEDLVTCW